MTKEQKITKEVKITNITKEPHITKELKITKMTKELNNQRTEDN